jgi:hypothetical protein
MIAIPDSSFSSLIERSIVSIGPTDLGGEFIGGDVEDDLSN